MLDRIAIKKENQVEHTENCLALLWGLLKVHPEMRCSPREQKYNHAWNLVSGLARERAKSTIQTKFVLAPELQNKRKG